MKKKLCSTSWLMVVKGEQCEENVEAKVKVNLEDIKKRIGTGIMFGNPIGRRCLSPTQRHEGKRASCSIDYLLHKE